MRKRVLGVNVMRKKRANVCAGKKNESRADNANADHVTRCPFTRTFTGTDAAQSRSHLPFFAPAEAPAGVAAELLLLLFAPRGDFFRPASSSTTGGGMTRRRRAAPLLSIPSDASVGDASPRRVVASAPEDASERVEADASLPLGSRVPPNQSSKSTGALSSAH